MTGSRQSAADYQRDCALLVRHLRRIAVRSAKAEGKTWPELHGTRCGECGRRYGRVKAHGCPYREGGGE